METALQFLRFVIETLVNDKDAIFINAKEDDLGILITIKVAPEDMGRIIGKNGSTIQSLRTLLKLIGQKQNARINLRIEEPEGEEVA